RPAPSGRKQSMRSQAVRIVMAGLGFLAINSLPAAAPAADPGRKAGEQALGRTGQLQAGDVFRVGMPRTDLNVTVKGIPVKAGFALGSYAAFKQAGGPRRVSGHTG